MESLGLRSILDGGCGTGRIALELARRGFDVVGVDVDPNMLGVARRKAPRMAWVEADLANLQLERTFDVALLAGNVMIFVGQGNEQPVVRTVASHLREGGLLIAGFQLHPRGLSVDTYDSFCSSAGLEPVERFATWDKAPWIDQGDYAVSVHRKTAS